ncbi:hypothetical protein CSA37_01970 [Candidatus Fermentibacteria bacterium]|nr:MAG: hypothetical protein CSA37_01970 [Candidatus Fermentibacteria bacterium]
MKHYWPEFLVLALFLAGDFLFSGMASAAAAAAAGVLAFLILLVSGKKKPALVVEGLFFGAVTAAGELTDFPGGTVILLELSIGSALLLSALFKWKLLERMSMGMVPSAQAAVMTLVMGSVFTVHSLVFTGLVLAGHGSLPVGILIFAVLYFSGIRFSVSGMNADKSGPGLVSGEDGTTLLVNGTLETGTVELSMGDIAVAEKITLSASGDVFLRTLEEYLRRKGCRVLSIGSWPEDEIDLEIRGYVKIADMWKKRL